MRKNSASKQRNTGRLLAGNINSWDNDPESGKLISRPAPNLSISPLALEITGPAPEPAPYPQNTFNFRYWAAAEALRRAADFWAVRVPSGEWQLGSIMPVLLDAGEDLNAYYDRSALNFFHAGGPKGTIYSGESPDIICHELGHAVLDSIKPQLWDAASDEVAAFHESFGDMSAILCALQLQEMRQSVLDETNGRLDRNSRLSRLAEQLGAAIRMGHPDAVDSDSLRNAANRFTYKDPATLPTGGPAMQLSSESHSFSRVFTGAFLEILAAITTYGLTAAPTEQDVFRASNQVADVLVEGVKAAAVVPNFYAQVAAGMVNAAQSLGAAYPEVLRRVFVRRSILSLQSAADTATVGMAAVGMAALEVASVSASDTITKLALPGRLFGLGDVAVLVEAPSQPRRFSALSGAQGFGSANSLSSETAAQTFVEGLFRRDRVEQEPLISRLELFHSRRKSHRLQRSDAGLVLERCLFDCGFHHH